MSETTSSPSVHLHPMSPSSSLSSTDSAPHSEPTSDEQPDLGAFTTVLREWTHLQPPPRIPVQIHSATSSTTPTYQPEQSVTGSDFRVRSRHSRLSNRSGFSDISSFTRPPSSSIQPEGSTVWNQAPIASYLFSSTPSNDVLSEGEEEEGYTPSPPNSLASTALTVEIASEIDFPSFDDGSHDVQLDSSPYPGIFLPIPLESDGQRLDSRETAHPEDEVEDGSSQTSRDYIGSHVTSVQLQSQARAPTSMSDSMSIPTAQTGLPSVSSLSNTNHTSASNSTTSTSTLITALLNQSRNPLPPRTTSDSSYTATGSAASSSNLSLLSYQIPETPPIEEEEEEDFPQPAVIQVFSSGHSIPSTSSGSGSLSLKSQKSLTSHSPSASASTLATQRQQQQQQPLRSSLVSSVVSYESPLFNPHSPLPHPTRQQQQQTSNLGLTTGFGVVDDLGTPDQPPSETLLFEPQVEKEKDRRSKFIPIDDLDAEDEVDRYSFGRKAQHSGYASGYDRPQAGPSSLRGQVSSSFQQQRHNQNVSSERRRQSQPYHEIQYKDDDDDDQVEEGGDDDYPYRYPYGHTPKSHAQALTPKGIPRSEPRTQMQTQHFLRQLEVSSQSLSTSSQLHIIPHSHIQKESHGQYVQQESLPVQRDSTQLPLQTQIRTRASMQTQAQALPLSQESATSQQPTSQTQPQTYQYPYPAAQSYGTAEPSNAQHFLPPGTRNTAFPSHSTVQSQADSQQAQSQWQRQGQGYPHSLLGLHALPASLVSPQAKELPVPEFRFEATLASGPGLVKSSLAAVSEPAPVSTKDRDKDEDGLPSSDDFKPLIVEADFIETSDVGLGEGLHLPTYMPSQAHVHLDEEEQTLPSLGYLDEALSFIAAERARWSAAREGPSANGSGGGDATDSREVGGGDDGVGAGSGQEGEGHGVEGGGKGKQVADNEPKRRRRRKRPPRAHATPQATAPSNAHSPPQLPPSSAPAMSMNKGDGPFEDGSSTPFTPGSSPKKKKRSKSASASASTSTPSKHSLLLESPSKSKNKGKVLEKEFLVPPPSKSVGVPLAVGGRSVGEKDGPTVIILRRPVPVDDDVESKGRMLSEDDVGVDEIGEGDSDGGGDGGKTPTNVLEGHSKVGRGLDGLLPIDYTGKKGRRVGRKERERERMKRELMKQDEAGEKDAIGDDGDHVRGVGMGVESDEDDNDDDDGVEPQEDEDEEGDDDDDDEQGENDSLSNMTLLKPPRRNRSRSRRRRGRETAYIHDLAGIGASGVYKSTPGTPRRFKFDDGDPVEELEEVGLQPPVELNAPEDDVFASKPNVGLVPQVGEKKKRSRAKRLKTLTRAKSDPELRLDAEGGASAPVGDESGDTGSRRSRKGKGKAQADDSMDILDMDRNQLQRLIFASSGAGSRLLLANQQRVSNRLQPPPDSKRGRLLTLANQLFQLFPEQREELGWVISRIEGQGVEASPAKGKKGLKTNINADSYGIHGSIATPTLKRKKSRKGSHVRTGSEGTGGEAFEFDNEPIEAEGGSKKGSVRFPGIDEEDEEDAEIDPRGLAPKKGDVLIHVFIDHSNILIGLLSHLKRHPPQRMMAVPSGRGRPVSAVLTKTTTTSVSSDKSDPVSAFAAVKSTSARPLPVPAGGEAQSGIASKRQPVPIPKPGNHPIPLPSFATMSRSLPVGSVLSANGKGIGREDTTSKGDEANSDGYDNPPIDKERDDSVGPSSLFVGSIKKEKKAPKHLWHAALALILERGRPITRRVVVTSSPLYQPMESIVNLGYDLRIFIRVPDLGDGMDRERHRDKDRNTGKGAQSSPVAIPGANLSAKKGHERRISGSTSTESGSGGGAGSGHASGGGGNGGTHAYSGIANNNTAQTKIKYREQGVDELLQLKLHQAIAATDDPPDGSTIVLATGDGNMGQFNEDGFLGPVRIALRRGWRVELYAWEDGLSRAWRREFGAGTEWGRRGMFRVIGMEQFASALVEASGWS